MSMSNVLNSQEKMIGENGDVKIKMEMLFMMINIAQMLLVSSTVKFQMAILEI